MINTSSPPKKRAANIRTDKLHTFEGHPFQVLDDEDMNSLTESIKTQGIISLPSIAASWYPAYVRAP